ncbi:MAG: hypothetical protein K9N46_07870 [Candidatus Marinimicrobia bacterium]|nr:hypothetical protein [Candidatus Neomarinimicrobiota bacterium]MCF7880640.1 hypothetical protein [Candidatus Neomarinimicrobiota bacterium]
MENFKMVLYEALLVAFGKVMAKYNIFAQGKILEDVGKEILAYLNQHGFDFEEKGEISDLADLTEKFVENGFAGELTTEPAEKGQNFIWENLYGIEAYAELHEVTDNPFLACPLNLCLYHIADKHNKTMKLHRKSFDMENKSAESQYEIVDKESTLSNDLDPLVIENARLYDLAQERADKLEKAYNELKTLRGILPICSSCKKIRDDDGYWQQVESYVTDHSEAMFSHGICPECIEKHYPEYTEEFADKDISKNKSKT